MIRRCVELGHFQEKLPKVVIGGSLRNETAWMNVLGSMNTWEKNLVALQE